MVRKFYSFPGGTRHVIVEVDNGTKMSPASMLLGAKELFGSDPDVALEWGQSSKPIGCTFRPGDEPNRSDAEIAVACPGMFFWLK